ncbi:hypothetical protein ADK77_03500, partial [Streptomyces antibioticus]
MNQREAKSPSEEPGRRLVGRTSHGRPGPLPSSVKRPRPSAVTVVLRSRTTVTGVSPAEAGEVLSWR